MMREFLTQMSKLSPTERQFVKKILGNQLKQKLSPAQFDIAFKEMEPKLGADLKPEELQPAEHPMKIQNRINFQFVQSEL